MKEREKGRGGVKKSGKKREGVWWSERLRNERREEKGKER